MEDVIERLRNFILANPQYKNNGVIQGLAPDGKVVIMDNGQEKKITIDELERGQLNQTPTPQAVQPTSNQMSAPVEEIEVMEEPSNDSVEVLSNETPVETVETNVNIVTLKEMRDAVLSKNEAAVDKALESFALDNTGKISMNKAIKIVTDNSTNNVIDSIKNNTALSNDLSLYDITGKLNNQPTMTNSDNIATLIDKSFSNILIYVEAARLKNIVYTPEQIESAKKKYATGVQDRINVLGLNKTEEEIKPDNVKEQPKAMNLELQPDKNLKKAGFADILILTVIVLVYAAIIINLIAKLR